MNRNRILSEAASSSESLFGGKSVSIPGDGKHGGKDWQSSKAWDIKADKGTPVYAIARGKVVTMKDYGSLPYSAEKGVKRLYGHGFTVKGIDGGPNVYYAHLDNVQVSKGDVIECGELLGYVGDSKWIKYDHVHIGVEPPHHIKDFITPNGQIKCLKGTGREKIGTIIPADLYDTNIDVVTRLKKLRKIDTNPDTQEFTDYIIKFLENPIGKSLYNMKESIDINKELRKIKNIFEEIDETANSLRQVAISTYGWKEKSGQLSDGGELKSDLTKIVNEIIAEFSKIKPGCKGRFTAGNDKFHHRIKSYKSRHTQGEAVDLTLPSECHKEFMNLMDKYKSKYNGFNYIDEYRNPTSKATGGHFHLSYRPGHPEGGKKSSSDIKTPDSDYESSEFGIEPEKTNFEDLLKSKEFTSKLSDYEKQELENKPKKDSSSDDSVYDNFVNNLLKRAGLMEEKVYGEFGKKISNTFGSITIPKDDNKKILSPVDGVINNVRHNVSCKNRFVIQHNIDNKIFFLEFCGVTNPKVGQGDYISKGDMLGETSDDVTVTLYNNFWDKQYITAFLNKEKSPDLDELEPVLYGLGLGSTLTQRNKRERTDKNKERGTLNRLKDKFFNKDDEKSQKDNKDLELFSDKKEKKQSTDYKTNKREYDVYKQPERYSDPLAPTIINFLTSPFTDKYDKSGKLVQKRWSYPTDKIQPDPFIKDFYQKNNPVRKKIKEDIERIKKLLK